MFQHTLTKDFAACTNTNQNWGGHIVREFTSRTWWSNGKYVMSTLHELFRRAGGSQEIKPSWCTIALIAINPAV